MKFKVETFFKFHSLLFSRQQFLFLRIQPRNGWGNIRAATYSAESANQVEELGEVTPSHVDFTTNVFRRWGCSDDDIEKIFARGPSLRRCDLNLLQNKLNLLKGLGVTSPDLVKMVKCRPRFLKCRINHDFDERIKFFLDIFESKEMFIKAVVRDPSLLTYDFHGRIKPVISSYEEMGLSKRDLVIMLISRPPLITRTSFDDEKIEYIKKTGLSKDSKLYKYIVTIIGVSRLETIREKLSNLEKYGFTDEEIFTLIGRSPLILTLSVDKVQRNMTFILSTLKLPANVILNDFFLLYSNLEVVLRPRVLLSGKMQEMGLDLQLKGHVMLKALRMTEKRFLKKFVQSQSEDVARELMEFYQRTKDIKRLAETSKKNCNRGFFC